MCGLFVCTLPFLGPRCGEVTPKTGANVLAHLALSGTGGQVSTETGNTRTTAGLVHCHTHIKQSCIVQAYAEPSPSSKKVLHFFEDKSLFFFFRHTLFCTYWYRLCIPESWWGQGNWVQKNTVLSAEIAAIRSPDRIFFPKATKVDFALAVWSGLWLRDSVKWALLLSLYKYWRFCLVEVKLRFENVRQMTFSWHV